MTDGRTGYDEESLPWLEEVEDEDARGGISGRKMLTGLLLVVAVAAAVAAVFFWLGRQDLAPGGAPELIRAPDAPYKVKPEDPGGLDVAGDSQTTFETSAGQDIDSRLDIERQPEAPPESPPQRIPPNETKEPVPAEPAQPPPSQPSGTPGSVIQLGAYGNTAQAERAWTALSTRFGALSALTKVVVPYSSGGSRGYRLRAAAASPDEARQVCQTLQEAGESCFIVR